MEQRKVDTDATYEFEGNANSNHVSKGATRPVGSRVVVDATHPRFLSEEELEPVTVSASTEDNFCQECKIVFATTPEAIRRHFRTIAHNYSTPCVYCGEAVYEYYYGDVKRYAHDCNSKTKK